MGKNGIQIDVKTNPDDNSQMYTEPKPRAQCQLSEMAAKNT